MASKSKCVVLVQPRIGYMDEVRTQPSLPLSLLHAASELVRECTVRIIDQRIDHDWRSSLAGALASSPLYIGVTASTGPMIGHALEISGTVRALDQSVPIVWGGTHPTMLPAQTVAHPLVDAVVMGDGEHPALEIARRLKAGASVRGVPGVMTKADGTEVPALPSQPGDLGAYTAIPLELVDIDRYSPRYLGRRSVSCQSSRGCPHSCRYCYNAFAHRRRWRTFSAGRIVSHVETLARKHRAEDIYFVDDNFFVHRDRALAIARGLKPLGCTWQVQGADLASICGLSDADLRELHACGLRRITMGIESGSPRIRRLLGKTGTPEEIVATVRRLAPLDIIIFGSFITNLPGETLDDLRESVLLIERLHQLNPHFRNSPFYSYTPFPGTPLFDDAVRDGFAPPSSLDGWARLSYEEGTYTPHGAQPPGFRKGLYLTSLLNDAKMEDYSGSSLLRLLAGLYRPIARLRLRHLNFRLMPELYAARFWF